ncbi:MAG TPA: efflux transporter outer membrane subunit [Planctomycetota bacterium]|nr:efflux transporter outer membrane subunit [Planctomycetota bacterium]
MLRTILMTALVGAAAGCTVGPDYERPPLQVPAGYKSAAPDKAGPHELSADWWKLFGDPDLAALEEAATRANQDLKAAVARVVQARAGVRGAKSAYYPTVRFDPSAERTRTSENTAQSNGRAFTFTDLRVPFDLSYEIDLWGKVRRTVEAAEAQAQASAADLAVVLHTIRADVAQNYFSMRSFDAQIVILEGTLASYRRQVELMQTQFRAGLVGRITIVQAEALLYATQSDLAEVRRQRADLEHALATLTGRPPSEFSMAAKPLDLEPPKVPAGLPADLLRKRPDVAEAELNLAVASAQIGVAAAQFYPDFTLTGTAGWESFSISHLPDWQSRIWQIGAAALVPIFEGGRLDATYRQAKARYEEQLAAYRSRVLIAFRDVEDALTDLHARADAAQSQSKAVDAAREYQRLAQNQYQQGLISYFQVIDAERTLLSNELSAAQILSQRMISAVQLIKALGAGWDPGTPVAGEEAP